MNRTTIAAIFADQDKLGGKTVTVCGWARTIRDMKTFGFIELNDGSCFRHLHHMRKNISFSLPPITILICSRYSFFIINQSSL